MMKTRLAFLWVALCIFLAGARPGSAVESIPLPEHPRPDFERSTWLNLNGSWRFRFDKENAGLEAKWFQGTASFPDRINVPFPWGSELSGVTDQASVAWYARNIQIPA